VSYNLIIFYDLALLLVICPFSAILFSLSAFYNLIIFYELALLLVICPFPAISENTDTLEVLHNISKNTVGENRY
jgi:energy-converting hydrogenase Eha subunit H